MKIREVITEGSNASLVTALELLKGKMSSINTDSLIRMVQNTGIPFNYQALASAVDSDDAVKQIIKNFNKDEVTFNTGEDEQPGAVSDEGNTVEKMAKRALNKRF